jgi:uncharacterized protein (DUF1501 family)
MNSTRREFIVQAGATALGVSALGTAAPESALGAQRVAKPKQVPTLIAVYLRGGADFLGVLVPYKDRNLASHRPTLAMPGPDSNSRDAVLPLDDTFGFNPNMKDLHSFYQKDMCVPVVCVGSPHATRSHFDAQDFMERGAPGLRAIDTGWLNRYLKETKTSKDANLRAVSLQSLLPRSLRGDYPVLAKPDQKADQAMEVYSELYMSKGMSGAAKSQNKGMQTKAAIQEFGVRTIEQLRELNEILTKSPAPTARYPNSGFARQMRDIAKIIKANRGMEVTALDIGGWDHHINEGPTDGELGRKLADVSGTLSAFFDDLGAMGSNVLVLVMSEFGRTVKENGNRGTDHGHGSFMLAVGGRLNGKKVYGKFDGLDEDHLYERRDTPVHTDFRMVFAESLKGMFGFDGMKERMFPDYTPDSPPLEFMKYA